MSKTPGITKLEVWVNNGNFNFNIEGVVGEWARISIVESDFPEYDDGTWYWLYKIVDYEDAGVARDSKGHDTTFKLISVKGSSWFKVAASSNMRIVIWDSTWDNSEKRVMYSCRLLDVITPNVEKVYPVPSENGKPVPLSDHIAHMEKFTLSLRDGVWEVALKGVLGRAGWIGLYFSFDTPEWSNADTYVYTKDIPGGISTHSADVALSKYNTSFKLDSKYAETPCRFAIWDQYLDIYDPSKLDKELKIRYQVEVTKYFKYQVGQNYNEFG